MVLERLKGTEEDGQWWRFGAVYGKRFVSNVAV